MNSELSCREFLILHSRMRILNLIKRILKITQKPKAGRVKKSLWKCRWCKVRIRNILSRSSFENLAINIVVRGAQKVGWWCSLLWEKMRKRYTVSVAYKTFSICAPRVFVLPTKKTTFAIFFLSIICHFSFFYL